MDISAPTAFDLAADRLRGSGAGGAAALAQGLQRPGAKANPEALKAAAQDFESFFLTSMMEQMFAGIETDGMFGGGQGESVFRSLLNQEYGKAIASSGGVGIADMVYRQMLALQEA